MILLHILYIYLDPWISEVLRDSLWFRGLNDLIRVKFWPIVQSTMLWKRSLPSVGGVATNLKVMRWSSSISMPVFHRGDQWDRRKWVAMIDDTGSHTYGDISIKSRIVANALQRELGNNPEKHKKISFLCSNNSTFVDAMWGIWRWGHVAVPLCQAHPTSSLEYYVKDSKSSAVIATKGLVDKVRTPE